MRIWKNYSLGIALVVMFVIAWALMTWTDWVNFAAQQAEHHQPADVFGASGYVWRWGLDTFSNWQADFLGQGVAVILAAYLLFKGSETSRDGSDDIQNLVQEVETQVRGPEAAERGQKAAQRQIYRGGVWRNYGLGYALLGAFLVSWILMTWVGWMHYAANQKEHGEAAQLFGTSGYIWEWMRETFMNWQADALGHGLLVILPAYLLYKGGSESRDDIDRIEAAMRRTLHALQSRQRNEPEPGSIVYETRPRRTSAQKAGFLRRYGLGIALVAFFLISWLVQTWSDWGYYVSDQLQHHSAVDVFGPSGFIWLWGVDTFSNWQSDLLWTGLLVMLGAYLIFQGSAESKDSDERIEEMAMSIERRVRGEARAQEAQQATSRHVFGDMWHNRGLAYSMIIGGIIAWGLMTWTGWMYFIATQHEHGSTATLLGSSGYIWDWARLTLENWQSDLVGNAAMVGLSGFLLYKGSAMSRGSDDEIEQSLERIQQALEEQAASAQTATQPTGSRQF